MDLLAQRYANPFLMLDQFIKLQQLHEFSVEILKSIAKERVHKCRWEYFLHKVWDDMSFEEYVEECERQQKEEQIQHMTHEQIGNVINDSKKMLEGYM